MVRARTLGVESFVANQMLAVALYWVNIVVLALSARVNLFQEFFCERLYRLNEIL